VDNPTPSVGQNVTFTVTATNTGPSDASGVAVTDPLAGLALVSATPSQGTYDTTTGTWTIGALPLSTPSATLTLVASVNTPGPLVNTATKTPQTEADPNPSNDQSSVSLNAVDRADIQVTKGIRNPTPMVGQQVTFTVTATNLGPSPATGVVVTDQLPMGLTFVSATPSQGSYDQASGTWTVGSVAASQSAVLSITATIGQAGPLTNTATKTAANEDDPNPGNDSGSVSANAPTTPAANLSVTKTGPATAHAGDSVAYTIVVTNAETGSIATGVVVIDPVPAGLTFVSNDGDCTTPLPCTFASIPPGGSRSIVATYTVLPDAVSVLNSSSVRSETTPDPDTSDNTASAPTAIVPVPVTSTTSTTSSTTFGTATTTSSPTTTTSPTTPPHEICDNCVDDDGNGLIDAEDPACCTPQSLTFTQARFRPGKSTLRAKASLADGAFTGIDPRVQDVRVQIRTDSREQLCCTIGTEHWQKLFQETFGFFDQRTTLCPPLRCVRLAMPKTGPATATVILGRTKPGSPFLTPVEVTISAGNQCTSGQLILRPTARHGAAFP
jgi:uncharacterized repeat protein (TIGR01451 family)